jgi:hypothetical protein
VSFFAALSDLGDSHLQVTGARHSVQRQINRNHQRDPSGTLWCDRFESVDRGSSRIGSGLPVVITKEGPAADASRLREFRLQLQRVPLAQKQA